MFRIHRSPLQRRLCRAKAAFGRQATTRKRRVSSLRRLRVRKSLRAVRYTLFRQLRCALRFLYNRQKNFLKLFPLILRTPYTAHTNPWHRTQVLFPRYLRRTISPQQRLPAQRSHFRTAKTYRLPFRS